MTTINELSKMPRHLVRSGAGGRWSDGARRAGARRSGPSWTVLASSLSAAVPLSAAMHCPPTRPARPGPATARLVTLALDDGRQHYGQ